MAKFEITWQAPIFEYREKDVSWYWISIIIAAIIVAFAAWQRDFLFGVFIVIAEILFIVWGNRVPPVTTFTVTDDAIVIEGYKTHRIKEFESWSIDMNADLPAELLFHFRSRVRPPLPVIVPAEKVAELRAGLETVLKEIEYDPTLVDAIEKFFRF